MFQSFDFFFIYLLQKLKPIEYSQISSKESQDKWTKSAAGTLSNLKHQFYMSLR